MTQLYVPCEFATHCECDCREPCPICGAPVGQYCPTCFQCQECREDVRAVLSLDQAAEAYL